MALSKKDYMKLCDLEMELDKIQDELKILFSFSIESGLGTDEETVLENRAIAIRREMAQFN